MSDPIVKPKNGFGIKPQLNGELEFEGVNAKDSATPVVGSAQKTPVGASLEERIEAEVRNERNDLEEPYLDRSSVTIMLVSNTSLYRKVNDKVLSERVDYIGSSISSSTTLASNGQEVASLFRNIVGVSPNHQDFTHLVKAYLNNIRVQVNSLGKTLDTSFNYRRKADYYHIENELKKIEEQYESANKSTLEGLKEALGIKISRINALESTKYLYGEPVNTPDYIIYRHCLLYRDIAKDIALINSDPKIRFYFKDDKREQAKLRSLRNQINKAKGNFVKATADDAIFNNVYILYAASLGLPIASALSEDRLMKESRLDEFSRAEPIKFNKIFEDKDRDLKAKIELLVARGELIRLPHNQNLTTYDGEFIGANMQEAVTWFKNLNNASKANAYFAKLSSY